MDRMKRPVEWSDPAIAAMMAETETCLNCGTSLKYHQRTEWRRNRGYCSLRCYCTKPPKMAYAEREWGRPIREVLVELLNQNTVEATAHLMGVQKQIVLKWLVKLRIRRVTRWEAG